MQQNEQAMALVRNGLNKTAGESQNGIFRTDDVTSEAYTTAHAVYDPVARDITMRQSVWVEQMIARIEHNRYVRLLQWIITYVGHKPYAILTCCRGWRAD